MRVSAVADYGRLVTNIGVTCDSKPAEAKTQELFRPKRVKRFLIKVTEQLRLFRDVNVEGREVRKKLAIDVMNAASVAAEPLF